jgi:hypothetical protein
MKKFIYLIGITAFDEDSYAELTPQPGQNWQSKVLIISEAVSGEVEVVARYATHQVRSLAAHLMGEAIPPLTVTEGLEFLTDLIITPAEATRSSSPPVWKSYEEWAATKSLLTVEEAFEAGRALAR